MSAQLKHHRFRGHRLTAVVAVAAASALLLGACGSSDEPSGAKGTTGSNSKTAQEVKDAASALAGKRDKAVTLETKKIGLVNILYSSEAAKRAQDAAVEAGKKLGWTIDTVDAGGDPTKSAAAMANFINQKYDAIIDLANPTAAIASQLGAAKKAGIPVINIVGVVDPNDGIVAQYVGNDTQMSTKLADYMVDKLKAGDTVAKHLLPIFVAEQLRDAEVSKVLATADIKTKKHETDIANLENDTQTATNAQLQADPDLAAIWADTDSQIPPIASTLKSLDKCGTTQLYGYNDNLQNLQAVRDGCVTALVTEPYEVNGYMAVDQLAQKFSGGDIAPDLAALNTEYGIELMDGVSTQVIDKSNVIDDPKAYSTPHYDYRAFFDAVWKSQFSK